MPQNWKDESEEEEVDVVGQDEDDVKASTHLIQALTSTASGLAELEKSLSENQLSWNQKVESEEEEVVELDADNGQASTSTASGM